MHEMPTVMSVSLDVERDSCFKGWRHPRRGMKQSSGRSARNTKASSIACKHRCLKSGCRVTRMDSVKTEDMRRILIAKNIKVIEWFGRFSVVLQ